MHSQTHTPSSLTFTCACIHTYIRNTKKFHFCVNAAWDNLRIDVYGFATFCEWFFKEYPSYYVVPIRITGSAVETLFAQYKYLSGNKLDAVNYTTARSKYICKKKVEATHHSGMYYRDIPLNIPSAPLEKKKYDRQKKKD